MNVLNDGERPDWAPDGIDLDRPSVARVYDYYLGGWHNFSVDREMAERSFLLAPNAVDRRGVPQGRRPKNNGPDDHTRIAGPKRLERSGCIYQRSFRSLNPTGGTVGYWYVI